VLRRASWASLFRRSLGGGRKPEPRTRIPEPRCRTPSRWS